MATASQITSLIRAFKENDRERFITTAIQLAAHEAKQGHGGVAHEIRELISTIKTQPAPARVYAFKAADVVEIGDIALTSHPEERLPEIILAAPLMKQLERMLLEYRERTKLQSYGMSPRRKSLLVGAPGTGKTMTARVLAGELHLPLYTVLMDKLVTKYMGETGAKLRQIFSCMIQYRGVYLFDEFDAIGGERSRDNDVGEMRRVLNTFLQLLELDTSDSLIVAATNEIEILDTALFRRFDDVLHYGPPDASSIRKLLYNKLGIFWNSTQGMELMVEAADGLSHAEISEACGDAIKEAILSDNNFVDEDGVISALCARKSKYFKVNE